MKILTALPDVEIDESWDTKKLPIDKIEVGENQAFNGTMSQIAKSLIINENGSF